MLPIPEETHDFLVQSLEDWVQNLYDDPSMCADVDEEGNDLPFAPLVHAMVEKCKRIAVQLDIDWDELLKKVEVTASELERVNQIVGRIGEEAHDKLKVENQRLQEKLEQATRIQQGLLEKLQEEAQIQNNLREKLQEEIDPPTEDELNAYSPTDELNAEQWQWLRDRLTNYLNKPWSSDTVRKLVHELDRVREELEQATQARDILRKKLTEVVVDNSKVDAGMRNHGIRLLAEKRDELMEKLSAARHVAKAAQVLVTNLHTMTRRGIHTSQLHDALRKYKAVGGDLAADGEPYCETHRVTWDQQQGAESDQCVDCGRTRPEHRLAQGEETISENEWLPAGEVPTKSDWYFTFDPERSEEAVGITHADQLVLGVWRQSPGTRCWSREPIHRLAPPLPANEGTLMHREYECPSINCAELLLAKLKKELGEFVMASISPGSYRVRASFGSADEATVDDIARSLQYLGAILVSDVGEVKGRAAIELSNTGGDDAEE